MGFWQHLVDSYDKNVEALKKAYPLSTTSISNNSGSIAIVVIDGEGNFIRYDKIEKKSEATKKSPRIPSINITIPASEESLKRTSTSISPYPVFEQYEYIKGIGGKSEEYTNKLYRHCDHIKNYIKKLKNGKEQDKRRLKRWEDYSSRIKKVEILAKKYDAYIAQLQGFAESTFTTKPVKAIYEYVKKRRIASDLLEKKLNDKTNIIFQIETPGNPQVKVWENEILFSAWHQYYLAVREKSGEEDVRSLDYVTGTLQPIATFHPKKISNASANAKLVSSNDKTNYTFRGKFTDSSEAVSIGYQSTQKVHQFLRYIIKDRGCCCGEQVVFSFTIGSMEKLLPPPVEDNSIWSLLQESQVKTESDIQIELCAETGFDYADSLRKTLCSLGYGKALEQHPKTAVVALDAVSDKSGRLAITFYRELDRNEYLEKIAEWHSGGKWHQKFWDKKNEKYVPYIGAPSVDKIIEAVHGKPRGGKDEKSYTKIKKAARERLLRCIFDGALLPKDYVVAAVCRASNPLGISTGGEFDRNARNAFEQVVSTACALIRKDYLQREKEDYKLSIEHDRTDRDYLFGRLLGAADKLEEYALYKKKNSRVVTAAIRHMQAFAQHPFRTWQTIHGCLNPYIQTVKGSFAFSEIEMIADKFKSGEYEKDTPLNGSYLLGYYHERAYINNLGKTAGNEKKTTDNTETEDNNDK